jgi:sec-independent protein translocase protein TatC
MAETAQPDIAPGKDANEETGARMSFFEHLVDLRKRLVNSFLAIGIGMLIGFFATKYVINYVVTPVRLALRANGLEDSVYYSSLQGYIGLYINLSFYIGLVIAMPIVLHQIWLFVAPGLYKHERRAVTSFILSSMFLFVCGVTFGYTVLLPKVLTFLIGFAKGGPIKPLISINEYFELVLTVLVGLGVIFELPVLIFILSVFGIVTPRFLLRNFQYAMVVITIVAAIVTPTPDATTMLIFMAPMVVLYFVGVLVSYLVVQRKKGDALSRGEAR